MEVVLVKVDKLMFLIDFVIIDMEEDGEVPIIFGTPYLATGKYTIDAEQGALMLRFWDEKATFKGLHYLVQILTIITLCSHTLWVYNIILVQILVYFFIRKYIY